MTLSPTFLRFLAVFALVASGVGLMRVIDSYDEKELHRKDFIQEYLLAKAVIDGESIYQPMPVLVAKYFDPAPNIPWKHPTPHTPVAAVLSVPIGFFPYLVAVTVWILFELCCLAVAVELLADWWGGPVTRLQKLVLFLMSLGLGPVIQELWYGQFSMILLVAVLLAWLGLRSGHDARGGACLGFAVALKFAAWPIGLFLLLRGRWRAVVAAGAVALALNLIAGMVVGWPAVIEYYTVIGPDIARQHHQHDANFSFWTVGGRLFSPDTAIIASEFEAPPLWPSASLDWLVTKMLPPLALVAAMILAWRCKQFDSAFGILLCASLPINPIAWDHYLLVTAIPIAIVFRRLMDAGFPRALTVCALIAAAITVFPNPAYIRGAVRFFGVRRADNMAVLPFAVGLITYLPLIPLATWIAILWRTDEPHGNAA